mmetsp:Transcript_28092/g.50823  ORF Transcript_28092/g.50823 Transcript_28092/m.50823 type:complete len:85 (-) Transcript_28092:524-778(-)
MESEEFMTREVVTHNELFGEEDHVEREHKRRKITPGKIPFTLQHSTLLHGNIMAKRLMLFQKSHIDGNHQVVHQLSLCNKSHHV